jgi:hypothetical protein
MEERMYCTEQTIHCSISVFDEQEKEIHKLTKRINETKDIAEKERCTGMMLEELRVLLSCQAYNKEDENCVNCRRVSSLRETGGEVVLKGIQVARKLKR